MDTVATAAAAPAAEPTPSPAAPAAADVAAVAEAPAKPLTKQQRREAFIARMRQGREEARAETSPPSDPPADEAEKPETDAATEPDETAEPAKVEPPKVEAKRDEDVELKLATYKRELKNARADLLELKPLADKARQFEEQLSKAREDPNAALGALKTLLGRDFGELTEWFVEHKDTLKTQQKYAELPPDVREEIALARKEREERAAQAKQQAERDAYTKKHTDYSTKIADHLSTHEDEFPLSAAFGKDVADDIARQILAQKGPVDARAMLKQYEEASFAGFVASLSNEKLVRQLLARKPELKAALAPLVGAATLQPKKSATVASLPNGQPARADSPPTLSNKTTASDVSTEPRPRTREERKREIREAFRRYQSA